MSYDAEATRCRIFDAATAEFAERGLAGARVERIATAARANKQAIYLYFGNKEALFGAVVRAKVDEVCHSGALDPDDAAETIGLLFDWYQQHPELIRLLLWEALESGPGPLQGEPERRAAYREKAAGWVGTEATAGAQDPTRTAQDWMFTVLGLVAWNFAVPQLCRVILDEDDEKAALARRRAVVVETVRTLLDAQANRA